MDWHYVESPMRTIEDSFKDLESIFKDKNSGDTPRIPLNEGFYQQLTSKDISWNSSVTSEDNNYVTTPQSSLVSTTLDGFSAVRPPAQSVQSPLDTLQTLKTHMLSPMVPNQSVRSSLVSSQPLHTNFQTQIQRAPIVDSSVTSPIGDISTNTNHLNWKPPQKKSSAIIPPWIHVPDDSRFFVIKSSSLEHVKKSFYNGIWSSTFYGNKRLSEAYGSLSPGAKIYLLFSVNASGRFCGVAEMSSNLRDDLDTSIWRDNSRYRHAFKVRWIVVRDVHNRSLKQFLVPANDMKPVTNSRDTQEIPATISKSILKLFKYEQSEIQSFLDDEYS